MTPRRWQALQLLVAPAVLGLLMWQIGHGPFVDGVTSLDARTLALGAALGVPATLASAWRWRVVAGALGAPIAMSTAVAACWSSQFLNSALPTGVAGDVYRGLRHAPEVDRLLGLRAVGWERLGGQLVQVVLAASVLLLLPSPLRPSPTVLLVGGAVGVAATTWAAQRAVVRADLGRLMAVGVLPTVVVTSLVAHACFVVTGLVAARAIGVAATVSQLVPLLLVMLVAMALPLSLAGWGPREGAAAWCFAMAGIGAEAGVATAVAYGVMATVASLPGGLVLVMATRRTTRGVAEDASHA